MPKGVPYVQSKRRNDPAWKDDQAWRALATALGYSTPYVFDHPPARIVTGVLSKEDDDE